MKILLTILLTFYTLGSTPDTVLTRFKVPAGYHQVKAEPGTFAAYLQNLPLKPVGTQTKTYKGEVAATDVYTAAVVDISVGNEDLQQCADALTRRISLSSKKI